MKCGECDRDNRDDARFCEGCGSELARNCASCGLDASGDAAFCRGCGSRIDGSAPAAGPPTTATDRAVRKTVTVLFADLGGSTTFEEQVDAETARSVMGRYYDDLRTIADDRGAGAIKFLGDGVMAIWGVPEVGPDDATGAIDAAMAMHDAFAGIEADVAERFGAAITLRVAINTGEVVVGDDDADIVGDAINVAARLEKECPTGRVVVGGDTWRATRNDFVFEPLGEVTVKGRNAPVSVHLLDGRRDDVEDLPFVGRSAESNRLQAAYDTAASERAVRLVTIVGEPGVGKTRLSGEFVATLDAQTVSFACEAGDVAALGPIAEMLRTVVAEDGGLDVASLDAAGTEDRDRIVDVLEDLASAGARHSVEETFWGIRRLVEVTATERPLVVVVDDIQWADPLLLDLLEHLVEWVRNAPVLVIALARPEIREVRPALGERSRWVSDALALTGLDEAATRDLTAALLGSGAVPEELGDRIPDSTRGNPLFVRELVRMLVDDGVLVESAAGWALTVDSEAIEIPPTVHSLLATRIERLDPHDRRLLEVAAVIGTEFDLGAVEALLDTAAPEALPSAERLRRLQLMEPAGAYAGDNPVWRFHHVLIRDVAYRRLLKLDRADLHQRLAEYLEEPGGPEADAVIARHLGDAHRYRVELGEPDEGLADRAGGYSLRAARRSLDREELLTAGTLARSAIELNPADRSLRSELAMVGCEALLALGDAASGDSMVERLGEVASETQQPWLVCFAAQLTVLTDPDGLPEAEADLSAAIERFTEVDDQRGLAKAHLVRARARARLGRVGDSEADLDQALVAARGIDDRRRVASVLGAAPLAALWGPSPVQRAGGRCLDVIRLQRITTVSPSVEATSMRCQAVLEALRGRVDNARRMIETAHTIVVDLGLRNGQAETELFEGIIETIAGDHVAAEPHLRAALDGLDALGLGVDAGQAAALLAKCLLAQGRIEDADRYASESEKLAGQNLQTAMAWRTARAELLAAEGKLDGAIALAVEAVDIGAGTDLVYDHAQACLTLAHVRAAAGDEARATDARHRGEELLAAKGALGVVEAPAAAPVETSASASRASRRLAVEPSANAKAISDAYAEAWNAGDIDAMLALHEPDFVLESRRRVVSSGRTDHADSVEVLRGLVDTYPNFSWEPLAVRGDRLSLGIMWLSTADGMTSPFLNVVERSANGKNQLVVGFDLEDFDDAVAELERRYDEGEGRGIRDRGLGERMRRAHNARDRAAIRRCLADDFVGHFPGGLVIDADQAAKFWVDFPEGDLRSWISATEVVAPGLSVSRTHRELRRDGEVHQTWHSITVYFAEGGLLVRHAVFTPEEIDDAFALAEEWAQELGLRSNNTFSAASPGGALLENHSVEWGRRFVAGWPFGPDLDGLPGLTPDFIRVDRRSVVSGGRADRAEFEASAAELARTFSSIEVAVLATRGHQLALSKIRFGDEHSFAIEWVSVSRVRADGHADLVVEFDPDDFAGAYDELERLHADDPHYSALDALARAWIDSVTRQDWDRHRTLYTDDFEVTPRRGATGWVQLDRDEFLAYLADSFSTVDHFRSWSPRRQQVGSNISVINYASQLHFTDDTEAAWSFIGVCEVRDDRYRSFHLFGSEFEDEAMAFARRLAGDASDGRLAVENAASGFVDVDAWNAGELDHLIATFEPDFVLDSRRHVISSGISVGPAAINVYRSVAETWQMLEHRTLAVRGERLALIEARFSDGAGYLRTNLDLNEVSPSGKLASIVSFDPEDLEEALAELDRRYFESEGRALADWGDPDFGTRIAHALTTRDPSAIRALVTDDFVGYFPGGLVIDADVYATYAADLPDGDVRFWNSATEVVAPGLSVNRSHRELSTDGVVDQSWEWVVVIFTRDGLLARQASFPPEEIDDAYALAEEWAQSLADEVDPLAGATHASRPLWRQVHAE